MAYPPSVLVKPMRKVQEERASGAKRTQVAVEPEDDTEEKAKAERASSRAGNMSDSKRPVE